MSRKQQGCCTKKWMLINGLCLEKMTGWRFLIAISFKLMLTVCVHVHRSACVFMGVLV